MLLRIQEKKAYLSLRRKTIEKLVNMILQERYNKLEKERERER